MTIADPERALTLTYAAADRRAALTALWHLDERLAGVVRNTKEDRLGAIRLAWWREALARLDEAPAPAEPLLQELAATLLPLGLRGAELGTIADGWAALLAPPSGLELVEVVLDRTRRRAFDEAVRGLVR